MYEWFHITISKCQDVECVGKRWGIDFFVVRLVNICSLPTSFLDKVKKKSSIFYWLILGNLEMLSTFLDYLTWCLETLESWGNRELKGF